MSWTRRLVVTALAAALAAAAGWALWPQPQPVDMAVVSRGPLAVSVSAEGVTRVRQPFAITAPIAGNLSRLQLEVGDRVVAGITELARISPAAPALMDVRSRAQAEAAVHEAQSALALADTRLRRAISDLENAQAERTRARALAGAGTISARALDQAEQAFTAAAQALAAARSERDLSAASLERARAQLIGPEATASPEVVRLLAPQSGIVLSIADPSARPVQPGTPLMTLGDLSDLEIEIDLLSADAVRVSPGARAEVDRWGGDRVLGAVVRRIEPAAFTRISALGIEEQRVRLVLDFTDPPASRPGLGERYRVVVRVILWEGASLLRVPQAALFRHAGGWAVFRQVEGRAVLTPLETGRQAEGQAEVLSGLTEGEPVVLYPASSLTDGARIRPRD